MMAAVNAHAGQTPLFNHTLNAYKLQQLQRAVPTLSQVDAPEIAAIDLNEDGISEYIVRTNQCNAAHSAFCDHEIIGQTSDGFISLGRINGRKIIVGQDYTKGVRNILLFATPSNDFAYDIYVWGAKSAQYVLKSDG